MESNRNGSDEKLKKAIIASCRNYERCCEAENATPGLTYKVKYVIWFCLLVFLSPKRIVKSKKLVCACTPVNEKRLKQFTDEDEYCSFGKLNSQISQIISNRSVLSPYTFWQRLRITRLALSFYFRNRSLLKGYLHFTLEYFAVNYFIENELPAVMITPGMYDRYSTLFTYLGHLHGIELIGVQDGAAVDICVPAKVYCDTMYVFDEFEESIIRGFIKNNDCKYIWTGFTSTLKWEHFDNKDGKLLIAFASQDWFTDKTVETLDILLKEADFSKFQYILYPHYRESVDSYREIIERYPQLVVETKCRHDNVDLLITFYSTIVYDFWSVNKDLQVCCIKIPGFIPGYYQRPNVKVFDTVDELRNRIDHLSR